MCVCVYFDTAKFCAHVSEVMILFLSSKTASFITHKALSIREFLAHSYASAGSLFSSFLPYELHMFTKLKSRAKGYNFQIFTAFRIL
jgi:hypothetical protein